MKSRFVQKLPESISRKISDCQEMEYPNITKMTREQHKAYLENWFECDGCKAADFCDVVEWGLGKKDKACCFGVQRAF